MGIKDLFKKKIFKLDNKSFKNWDIQHGDPGQNVSQTDAGITVKFKKGGIAASSGINLKCVPKDVFQGYTRDVVVKYNCYVPQSFDWVKGGKLPGVFLGKNGTGGREWKDSDGSVRLMFRPDGIVTVYLYLLTDGGARYNGSDNCSLMERQGSEFRKASHHSNGAGIYLFRKEKQPLRLENGRDNKVSLRIRLNDKNKANGKIVLKIGNQKKVMNGIMFAADPESSTKGVGIGGFQFASWFGGGDASYAPNTDQTLFFKDFVLIKRS